MKKFWSVLAILLLVVIGVFSWKKDWLSDLPLFASLLNFGSPVEEVSETGLLGHWSMKTNSTTVIDETGNNDGTNYGATPAPGIVGQALSFDASSTYIDMGSDTSLTATSGGFSICVKAYPNDVTTTQRIVHKGGQDNTNYDYTMAVGANDIIFGVDKINGSVIGIWTTANNLSAVNEWYDICGTWDGDATTKVYIDGALQASQAASITNIATSNLHIGRRVDGTQYFDGLIDDVKIYNRELTTAEITEHYNQSGRNVSTGNINKGLIGHWSLAQEDLVDTDTFADLTPNENNGDSTNTPSFTTDHEGTANSAMTFNGSTDNVDVGDSIIGTTEASISVWIYPTGWGEASFGEIVNNGKTKLYLRDAGDNLGFSRDSLTAATSTVNGISLDEWSHVVVTSSANSPSRGNYYINGVLAGSGLNFGEVAASGENLKIGGKVNDFAGRIEDVRIYNRILSAEEAITLYDSYKPEANTGSFHKGLVGQWGLGQDNEITGSEMIVDLNFDDWTNTQNGVSDDANTFHTTVDGAGGQQKSVGIVIGQRYVVRVAGTITAGAGSYTLYGHGASGIGFPSQTGTFDVTHEFTGVSGSALYHYLNGVSMSVDITAFELYELQAGDSTPNTNNGTLYQDATVYGTDHKGTSNGAMEFNGTSDYIDMGDILDPLTNDFTVSVWINIDDYGVYNEIVAKSSGSNGFIIMTNVTTGELRTRLGTAAGNLGSDVIPLSTWTHLIVVFDRSGNAIGYINGLETGTLDVSGQSASIDIADTFKIGQVGGGNYFDGSISNVSIYNRALTADEIQLLYDQGQQ